MEFFLTVPHDAPMLIHRSGSNESACLLEGACLLYAGVASEEPTHARPRARDRKKYIFIDAAVGCELKTIFMFDN